MGTFRCGLLLCLALTTSLFAQVPDPVPPTNPPPVDPNAPVVPPTVAPEVDPNLPATLPQPGDPNLAAPTTTISTNAAAHAPKPKKVAPQIPTARGTVARIDNVGMTITVDNKGKEQTFKVTSRTRIFADAKPAIFADGKQGEKVVVEYKTNKDKSKEATALRFGSLTLKK